MASISSLGVGSNLDLSGLLDRLKSAESQPLVQIQRRQASYTAKLSAYGTVRDALETLRTAAQRVADPQLLRGVKASVSAPDVFMASASAQGAVGSYSVEVLQLAQSQSLAAGGVADPKAPIGKGVLTLDFGQVSGGSFDAATGRYTGAAFQPDAARPPQTLVIDDSNNSLEGLRDAINQRPELGLVASIVQDGSGTPHRLVLTGQATGDHASLRMAVDGEASLQALVAHDPAGAQALQQTAAAGHARLKVNGLAISAPSNTVRDAVQGTTLTLSRPGTAQLGISRDTTTVESALGALVNAFNALQTTAMQLTRYNQDTKTGSALTGDATLRQVQTGLRGALTTPQPGSLQTLSAVGVGFQKDGTLALDVTKLRAALAGDRDAVVTLLAGSGSGPVKDGAAQGLADLVLRFTGEGGLIRGATEGVKASMQSLDARYTAMQESIQAKMARYRTQFKQLDLFVSRMNATTSYLSQQFEGMAASKK